MVYLKDKVTIEQQDLFNGHFAGQPG